MSVRVRKLARELERSAEDVLWLLADHLMVAKYTSAEDMLPDEVAQQVRRVARKVAPSGPQAPQRRAPAAPATAMDDLMASAVPGVVPVGGAPRRAAPKKVAPASAPAAGPAMPTLVDERRAGVQNALADERRRLDVARADLEAARASLVTERLALEVAREALTQERAALGREAELSAGEQRARSLAALLDDRGLKGPDEHGRALSALAGAGHLARMASGLVAADPAAVRQWLRERLTLASGTLPEGLGPVVVVSPDRADVRLGPEFDRLLSRLSESWLLDGRRRVVFAGVPPRFQGLLRERVDRRIDLIFRAGLGDLKPGDLAVAWNVDVPPSALAAFERDRVRVVPVRARTFAEALERLSQPRSVA